MELKKISDICVMRNGKKRPETGSLYPVYGGNGIMDYSDIYNDEDVVIVGRVGAYCGCVYRCVGKCWVSDNAISVKGNNHSTTSFLYYLLTSLRLNNLHVGGAQPLMTQDIIGRIEVPSFSLGLQQTISNILYSFDSKIELNRRINDNLERQAEELFRSWFVDFEPFKGGRFVESELGMIPEGWFVSNLGSICDVIGGGTPHKSNLQYYCRSGIAWITPKDLSNTHAKFTTHGESDITEIGYLNSSAKIMPKGTVLFSSRAPIGYISIASNELCTNQGFKSLVPKVAGTCYLYLYMKEKTEVIEAQATGSTFKEASGSLIKAQPVIIPSNTSILDRFEDTVSPIFHYQEILETENRNLARLRDTLLPKLMSGKLKISEV